jgi:excisionase family DNA binding protein
MTADATPTLKINLDLTEEVTTLIRSEIAAAFAQYEIGQGYLDTRAAAEYLGCPRSRVYDLVSLGLLTPHRDGTRLKFTTECLDTYMRGVSP